MAASCVLATANDPLAGCNARLTVGTLAELGCFGRNGLFWPKKIPFGEGDRCFSSRIMGSALHQLFLSSFLKFSPGPPGLQVCFPAGFCSGQQDPAFNSARPLGGNSNYEWALNGLLRFVSNFFSTKTESESVTTGLGDGLKRIVTSVLHPA
jgi:hypothetical protein